MCFSRWPSFPAGSPSLTVLLDEPIGTISPRIYGHFCESIGRLIYEGVWVGPGSKIRNLDGYRLDTLEALQRVRPAVFRWPGGCFADTYHWEDGIGESKQRRMRRNLWWPREEPNTFGTDEFLHWCGLLHAEPYLSLNVGTGTPAEALNWVEYCNGTGNSAYAAKRASNGHAEPYGVRLWGVGNETWGCGGLFTPAEYAEHFRNYAVFFKRMGMSSDSELVAVGHTEDNWNSKFLEAAGNGLPYVDHLSIHKYFRRGHSTKFSDTEYVELMLDIASLQKVIEEGLAAIDQVESRRAKIPLFGTMPRKPMGFVVDEWGIWHPDAPMSDGFPQNSTLRDAIFAASCLNLFQRYANRITMTNIAQLMNCLHSLINTDGAQMTLTPTFYVYEMYRDHQGAQSVRTEMTDSPELSSGSGSRPALNASASRSGNSVLITVVNQDPDKDVELRVSLKGVRPSSATATNLTGASTRAENTASQPNNVASRPHTVEVRDGGLIAHVPAKSVQAIRAVIS